MKLVTLGATACYDLISLGSFRSCVPEACSAWCGSQLVLEVGVDRGMLWTARCPYYSPC